MKAQGEDLACESLGEQGGLGTERGEDGRRQAGAPLGRPTACTTDFGQ